ncbi:MAG: triose-phosphate isomerase [Acidiferrobacteraceae bacterium]
MRRPLVVGNWKMHGTQASARALAGAVLAGITGVNADVGMCPPFALIPVVTDLVGPRVWVGGQDLNEQEAGAFTGETSGVLLKDLGCRCVIVGHSERRTLYGDTDSRVAEKFRRAQTCGLTPILCVGETLSEREAGLTEAVVARQLDAVVDLNGIAAFADAVVAYEPVWAIGTGRNASAGQAQLVHGFIRSRFAGRDPGVADRLRILYGGSVKAVNAGELFAEPDIDGGLIGGASLKAEEFLAICCAVRAWTS